MKISEIKISELIPYEKNPRNNEEAIDYVAESIKQFGFKVPIIIDKDNVIVAGHTRLRAAEKLGLETVPCIIADDLTEEQIKAFRLADNKVSEFATWDFKLLEEELMNIKEIDMDSFGFDFDIKEFDDVEEGAKALTDDKYTTKVEIPHYEITGECPEINELVDEEKTIELIKEIEKSNVTEEQKKFLIKAAYRHNAFNYANIAEYYAHQDTEMQELMERSALVIIDYDDAIKNGYMHLKTEIENMEDEDYEE